GPLALHEIIYCVDAGRRQWLNSLAKTPAATRRAIWSVAGQGDDKAMLKAVREALEKTPKDLTIRAKIANFIY
ncbi:MAG TPA: hypothetical protein GX528_00575, partial [Firmicutes bacterium]|nr:hypothetical protein [Bacillota bacterium]